jgi:hypothetical protein
LAAVEQGIPVIAVRNNTNLMRNDLRSLPFRPGQLLYAQNYYEAAGMLAALRAGVAASTLERPMRPLRIERVPADEYVTAVNGHGNGHAASGDTHNGKLCATVNGAQRNGRAKLVEVTEG